jgi:hypothetical protein
MAARVLPCTKTVVLYPDWQSATTFKLVRNYNEINTRKAATFSGASTAATVNYINASNVLGVLSGVFTLNLDPADRIQDDFNLQIPLHVGYAYAQAQATQATNVIQRLYR